MCPRRRGILVDSYKYGFVGVLGTLIDVAVFNAVVWVAVEVTGEVFPVIAKTVSTIISAGATYVGHGFWTFRGRGGSRTDPSTIAKFSLVTGLGLVISVGILGTSHYIVGLQSVAHNNTANAIALVVSAVVRFVATRHWVFLPAK